MTDKAISPLRRRLIEDMAIRRLGPKTQHHYIRHVKRFADFLGQSADKAVAEDVHRYQLASTRLGCGALTGPVASRFRQPAPPRVRGAIPPCGHLSLSRVYVSDIDVWRTVETAAWIRSGAGIRSP